MRRTVIALLAAAMLLLAGTAHAAARPRPATPAERRAILVAAGFKPTARAFTSGCVVRRVRILGRYAWATFAFRTTARCVRYGFNGSNGFRLVRRRWRQIFVGSEPPPCRLGIPRALTRCGAG